MRDIAIVAFAQTPLGPEREHNEVELVMPVVHDVLDRTGLDAQKVGFTVSGSNDYLMGQPFSFVAALDAVGAWPPIEESHVEMDGAWALYEAWVRLQHGDIDTALVYAFGKSTPGDVGRILSLQLEPYTTQPLWPRDIHLAALQARLCLEAATVNPETMAALAAAAHTAAAKTDAVSGISPMTAAEAAESEMVADPLRRADCPVPADGAAAVILAAGDVARELCERPAWITGIDHRIEAAALGVRDLTTSTSTAQAAAAAGVGAKAVDVVETAAPFSHQVVLAATALGLAPETTAVELNPSGGALPANATMVTGLVRMGAVAERIINGQADRGVAHATAGHCLQQNLVAVLEGSAS